MGETTALKVECLRQNGSSKATHKRINKNGDRIRLSRLYRLTAGYVQPSQEERTLLCQILQKPAKKLFPDAGE